jgi:hypothetical protein
MLLAPVLPVLHGADARSIVAGALGAALLALCAVAVVPAADGRATLTLALLGAFLLVAALDAAGAGAAASVFEALLYGFVGAGFAAVLDTAALAVALPLFVAVVDAATVLGGGPSALSLGAPRSGDPLTLELPAWGGGAAGHVGIVDMVFLAAFAAYARRHGLRVRAAGAAMALGLAAAFAVQVLAGRPIPALPFLAAGLFVPNADRLGALFRRAGRG